MMPEIFGLANSLLWLGEFIILLFELNPELPEQLPEHPSLSGHIPAAASGCASARPRVGADLWNQ